MVPKLMIATVEVGTYVFLDGRYRIGVYCRKHKKKRSTK